MNTATAHTAAPARNQAPTLSLDDLAAMSFEELDPAYRSATVPSSLHAVDGHPRGRMLAVRGLDRSPLAAPLRRFAGSSAFVWGGKSFTASSDRAGRGINRVRLGPVLGRQNLFPFETRFAASAIDGAPTIVLDYDLSENPPYIRKIHDEIREVSPGLFLGPAMWKTSGAPAMVLWFALDTRSRSA